MHGIKQTLQSTTAGGQVLLVRTEKQLLSPSQAGEKLRKLCKLRGWVVAR